MQQKHDRDIQRGLGHSPSGQLTKNVEGSMPQLNSNAQLLASSSNNKKKILLNGGV